MQKQDTMSRLRIEAEALKMEMCEYATNLVWGKGNLDSRLVIVGEAPGAQEDRIGRPFVGMAGRILSDEIEAAGIDREQIYITNVIKCRPVLVHNGRIRNRVPKAEEIKAWSAILKREIEIVSPAIIMCLGAIAASVLIHARFTMSIEHGKWFDCSFGRVIATYHPSYLRWGKTDKNMKLFRSDLLQAVQLMSSDIE